MNYNSFKHTKRAEREQAYYDKYYDTFSEEINVPLSFESINLKLTRPWSSYWYIDKLAVSYYNIRKNKILDLGCGTGARSIKLAKIGYKVSGIDVSNKAIKLARIRAIQYKLNSKIYFNVGMTEKLPFPSEYFDVVYGVDILHHVDIEQTIKELHRVLKLGGRGFFREHLRNVVFDRVRETELIMKIYPRVEKYEEGLAITQDEKKLTKDDLKCIRKYFLKFEIEKFTLFDRFTKILNPSIKIEQTIKKIDWLLFKYFPILKKFAGSCVISVEK